MTTRKHDDRRAPRRGRGDDGAALVEFALISGFLFLLLFSIIQFGLILSFDQNVTRAAAEGARGGAVAVPLVAGQSYEAAAKAAALSATNDAVKEIGGRFENSGCSTPGMHCDVPDPVACESQIAYKCITVTITYDYDDEPLYGDIPFVSLFQPDQVIAKSVVRINKA